MSQEFSGFDVRQSLRVLIHRRWIVVLVAFVVVALALVLTLLQTPQYAANAKIVFVKSNVNAISPSANSQSLNPARDIQTEIEIMTSNPIRQMVAAGLHAKNAPRVSVSPVTDTNAIRITAESSNPTLAARIANGYADTYLAYRHSQQTNALKAAGQVIRDRIAALQTQIEALDAQIAAAPAAQRPTVDSNISPQRAALISQQTALQQQLDQSQVDAALSDASVQIGDRAVVPSSPASPRPVKSAGYALALGLALGVGLAFLVEYIDDSVKSKDDAERAARGVDTLGLIPMVSDWKARDDPVLVSLSAPNSPAAEAYRGLRTAINFLAFDASLRLILVTSPSAGEGKTTTAANLAVAFGDTGLRVCVISADLRRPRIHEFFGVANNAGLTSVLAGQSSLNEVTELVESTESVYLLASGPPTPKPSELLAARRTEELLRDLSERFDIALVDSPPVLPVTDASVLAGRVDGVLMVTRVGVTKRRALVRAMDVLDQVGAPLLGLVVNGAEDDVRYGYSSPYYDAVQPQSNGARSPRRGRSTTH